MSDTTAGLAQIGLLVAALAVCYRPLGAFMARVYTSEHDTRVERALYRIMGVDPRADQRWAVYEEMATRGANRFPADPRKEP